MKIYEALAGTGYPVCHPPYQGDAGTYITYQIAGQDSILYAESGEAETTVMYGVNIFSDHFSATILTTVKEALESAGYIVTVEAENYDKDHKKNQIALIAEVVGAEYG